MRGSNTDNLYPPRHLKLISKLGSGEIFSQIEVVITGGVGYEGRQKKPIYTHSVAVVV